MIKLSRTHALTTHQHFGKLHCTLFLRQICDDNVILSKKTPSPMCFHQNDNLQCRQKDKGSPGLYFIGSKVESPLSRESIISPTLKRRVLAPDHGRPRNLPQLSIHFENHIEEAGESPGRVMRAAIWLMLETIRSSRVLPAAMRSTSVTVSMLPNTSTWSLECGPPLQQGSEMWES